MRHRHSDILVSQNFQDLSGQTLKKVIKLVQELESNMVELLALFGATEATEVVEISESEEEPSKGSLDQDDADAVLKELGFE